MLSSLLVVFHLLSGLVSGTVKDQKSGEPLTGATVLVVENGFSTATDAGGKFVIPDIDKGNYTLKVSFVGYETLTYPLNMGENQTLEVVLGLQPSNFITEEVVVKSTRADDKSGIAHTNLSKAQIKEQNLGQDLPYLLNITPSVVVTSDAGAGVGYTGVRIRGSDATRINATLNGIPLNDAESQGSYWVDLPDLASSADNIQVQRGVGSSTNGAGAFGGSINIQTTTLNKTAYAEVANTYGSYNTWKHTLMAGTGLLNNKFVLDARLSKINSDGYINRAASDLKSFFVSGAYYGSKKSMLRVNIFSGKEVTGQAWNGVPEARLKNDSTGMAEYIANNGLNTQQAANLLASDSRRYNAYIYGNQTDNYQQDHYQVLYSKEFSENWNINAALHYTRGKGYYEEYRYADSYLFKSGPLSNYGIDNLVQGSDTIKSSDLIRRQWLDNYFFGATFSANYDSKKWFGFTLGGAANRYIGGHYGEVLWVKEAINYNYGQRYYNNDAWKTDVNGYAKLYFKLSEQARFYTDLQLRNVSYSFLGYNQNLDNVQQQLNYLFFNPKAGFNFDIDTKNSVFASLGVANREPNRDDMTQSTPQGRPKNETLYDLEAGFKGQQGVFVYNTNFYYMYYHDQLVLTGKVNNVGAYIRTNVPKSYRMGLELQGGVKPVKQLTVLANATFSQNKISTYSEYIDDWDNGGQIEVKHSNTNIAFSPNIIIGGQIIVEPVKNLKLTLLPKYVGKQYLDNTSNESRKIDGYFVTDFRVNYGFAFKPVKEINLSLAVNNLTNTRYQSNGWNYVFMSYGKLISDNNYYPQAGTNFLLAASVKF